MKGLPGIFAILLLVGCAGGEAVPKEIIARDQMEKILWDLIQADQYTFTYIKKDSAGIAIKQETMRRYDQVFAIHRVSREIFQQSLKFYMAHPDLTKSMMDSLSVKASRQRAEVYNHPPAKIIAK